MRMVVLFMLTGCAMPPPTVPSHDRGDPLAVVRTVYVDIENLAAETGSSLPYDERQRYLSSALKARLVELGHRCARWRAALDALPADGSMDDVPAEPQCEIDTITCGNGYRGVGDVLALVSVDGAKAAATVTPEDSRESISVELVDEDGWKIDKVTCRWF
jgi:hypothetical protein